MQQAPAGAMIVVLAAESAVAEHLAGFDGLGIAAVNAPEVIVVSGPVESVARLRSHLDAARVLHRMLPAQRAFHSWLMADAAAGLDEVARTIVPRAATIEVISSVSGEPLPRGCLRPVGYWAQQLRSPVRFQAAVESAMRRARVVFAEVGPGTGLIGSVRQVPLARKAAMVAVQARRGELLNGVGTLWASGVEVDWATVRAGAGAHRVRLPTYPFAATRHWLDAPALAAPAPATADAEAATEGAEASTGGPEDVLGEIVELWRSMLGVPVVQADSDFFALGGESLLFIRMISRVRRRFGVAVEIADLVHAPTPEAITAQVRGE